MKATHLTVVHRCKNTIKRRKVDIILFTTILKILKELKRWKFTLNIAGLVIHMIWSKWEDGGGGGEGVKLQTYLKRKNKEQPI